MSAQKFFRSAFAATGDVQAIPDTVQGDGSVSYPQGFGPDYELNPETDPDAKRIPRDQTNELFKALTENVREYQLAGFPEWVTTAQNGGSPLLYPINAYVRNQVGGVWRVWRAKVNDASLEPGVGVGWADEWEEFTPVNPDALKATQTETNQGTGDLLAGALELVKAAREGRWWYMGLGTWAAGITGLATIRMGLPGDAPWTNVAASKITFQVPTANATTQVDIAVRRLDGVTYQFTARLLSATGLELSPGDLQPGVIYEAVMQDNIAYCRLVTPVMSDLQRYASAGDGAIFGYVATNTPGAVNTQVTMGFGNCRDTTNQRSIPRAAPLTKRLDQIWAVGNGNGGRDTVAAPVAGDTWHVHAILNDATGVTDVLFSKSITAPTLPGGYTFFRRVFSITLDGSGNIRQFLHVADQDYVAYKQRTTDWANTANGVAAGTLRAIPVPKGLKLRVRFYYGSTTVGGAANPAFSGVYDPDVGVPVFGTATQWAQVRVGWSDVNHRYITLTFDEFCNNNAQVYTASNDSGDVIVGGVLGYFDYRGKFG